jgi:phosphatidylethanolamine/phosphatidyl-N-methylethanolamine N-methyltransferase
MPLPALQRLERKFEEHIRLFERKRGALEKKIETHMRLLELKRGVIERKIEFHFRRFEEKNRARLDDEVRFIRTWIEKPLSIGAVTPSSRVLARAMASYVDPHSQGPVIELGPGTGPVTEALVAQGIDPARLILLEYDPHFCRLLRERYPTATVVQGDAYSLKRVLGARLPAPAAAVVSGLPLITKPVKTRLKLIYEAFALMLPGAPFVQFTYATVPPIPKALDRVRAEASDRIWMNIPPARIWVYRRD